MRSRPVEPVWVPSAEWLEGEDGEGPRAVLGRDSRDCRVGEMMGFDADLGVV